MVVVVSFLCSFSLVKLFSYKCAFFILIKIYSHPYFISNLIVKCSILIGFILSINFD